MMETDDCCPLCMEDMDVTDRNFRPCKCGYQICLFCYRHIKDDLNGLCPACRTPYDDANITYMTPDPQEMARLAREKKAKELKDKKEQQAKEAKEKRESELKSRQEAQARAAATASSAAVGASSGSAGPAGAAIAAGVRPACASSVATGAAPSSCNGTAVAAGAASRPVVKPPVQPGRQEQLRDMAALRTSQRAIVYVMGLSPRIAKEEILRRHEYFGQYGKIMRIQVSPAGSAATSGPPSLRCCITYATREEAEQAVLAVDNVVLDGRTLKASFGMPKPPPGPLQLAGGADGVQEDKEEVGMKEEISGRSAPSSAPIEPPVREAMHSVARTSDRSMSGWDGSHAASASAPLAHPSGGAPDPVCNSTPLMAVTAPASIAVAPPPPLEALAVPPPPEALARRAPGPPPPVAPLAELAADSTPAVGISAVGAGMAPIGAGATGMRAMELARGSSLLSGQPTGSESEPWSMMGSFEDILNGLVNEEPEEEETTLPGSSRFARFFNSSLDDSAPVGPVGGGAPLVSSLGGIKLDTPFEPAGGKQQDDLQQGFRALLPNVNISFSPFGDRGGPSGSEGLLHGQVSAAPSLGAVGSLGSLGFGSFSAPAVGGIAQVSAAGAVFGSGSGGASAGLGAGSFEMPSGGLSTGLGSAALNGGSSLPGLGGTAPSTSDVSLLHQLSGPLPGAQLPGSQLSSQLQSLLQGANGASGSTIGSGRLVGGAGGGDSNGRWASSRAPDGLMPGWMASDGLLPTKAEDGAPASEGSLQKEQGGNSARGGKKEGGNGDRGGKGGKKRGGANNRSNKGGEAKPAHSGGK